MRRSALLLAVFTALGSRAVLAHPNGEEPPDLPPPPTYKATKVLVDEHLGATVPLDARFRTQDGTLVTLGGVFGGSDLPTILTFNYSDCPMLCSLQLNGLTTALPIIAVPGAPPDGAAKSDPVAFRLGTQFRIIS